MLRRASTPTGRPAEGEAQPAHAGPTDRQRVAFLQLLRQVHIVEARVHRPQQPHPLLAELRPQPAPRHPPPIPVQQPPHALGAKARLQPFELPHAQPQRPRPFLIADLPVHSRFHEPGPGHFLPAHRKCLHMGGTFSQSSYGVTFL
jgi:hypothetical protein